MQIIKYSRRCPVNDELIADHRSLLSLRNSRVNPMIGIIISCHSPNYSKDILIDYQKARPAIVIDMFEDNEKNICFDTICATTKGRESSIFQIAFPSVEWLGKKTSESSYLNIQKAHRLVLDKSFFPLGFKTLGKVRNEFLDKILKNWNSFGNLVDITAYDAFRADELTLAFEDELKPGHSLPPITPVFARPTFK